jgi:hypothetical protein
MKKSKSVSPVTMPTKRYVILSRVLIVLGVFVVGIVAWMIFWSGGKNYAKEAANPTETTLVAKGAEKLCSREDNGRGSDNKSPWYYGIYRITKPTQQAKDFALDALKINGFNNFKQNSTISENTLSDTASKMSNYSQLKDGSEAVSLEVLTNSVYSKDDNQFCTIKKSDNAPQDQTLVRITFSLPEYK